MYLPKVNSFGVDIPEASKEYMVVGVTEILSFAKDIFVMLVQHDSMVLSNYTINKMVLWRAQRRGSSNKWWWHKCRG